MWASPLVRKTLNARCEPLVPRNTPTAQTCLEKAMDVLRKRELFAQQQSVLHIVCDCNSGVGILEWMMDASYAPRKTWGVALGGHRSAYGNSIE